MKTTIKDIAKEAGVSIATISLIINGKAELFSPKTVKKVNEAIEKLNYQPNYFAKNLNSVKSNTIGLIVPDVSNPFFSKLANSIENALNESGYLLFLCNSAYDLNREQKYINEMLYRSIEGIIFASAENLNEATIEQLGKSNVPYILMDRPSRVVNNGVFVDDYTGGVIATEHLISNGHTKIACLSGAEKFVNISERGRGYIETMKKHQLTPIYSENGTLTVESGYKEGLKLCGEDISAIFVCNDLMAIGVYEAINELGKVIPADISVLGFDDITTAQYLTPKLTTIHQPIEELGKVAVENLVWRIQNKNEAVENYVAPVTLVERSSVKFEQN
ncbi:putative LacI family transcriptional regulator [Listeria monocytogenes]|uniref:LacI family DNA-binding transcriptional regulator n=1 Tax=Listeria monocytogenes TaxID=1639 RepID=UPI000A1D54B0|nr:LacI family DNA-binding transcriptional regulator [Listeria monocytogenes]ARM74510.1 putative LacI family transcriptional regulator [Listeria monocytogenes]